MYDIDTLAADYKPVEVKFRGQNYTLGDSVDGVLGALEVAGTVSDKASAREQMTLIGPMLAHLCPPLGAAIGDPAALPLAERLLFLKVIEEALQRVTKIPFRSIE